MEALDLLKRFDDLIKSIEIIEYNEEERVSKLKIRVLLFDNSILWVREVKIREKLIAYSYYWLRSNGKIIIGWDNAPHHREISTFPHHKHVGKNIEPSHETNLEDVLEFIHSFYFE
ncbi:MAG: hypothetical protein D6748_12130 [Calditrichaeota bacterium]|nr:MAG: hypothetical protein D6748_12130 [Calditrichota bacterium]